METISAASRAIIENQRRTLENIQQYQRFGLIITKIARM
jgi:hypothetical protein